MHRELQIYLPHQLKDNTFAKCLENSVSISFWLDELLIVLQNQPQDLSTKPDKIAKDWRNACAKFY